jgi:hypothetical protein
MPPPCRRPDSSRRALELLASCRDGCTEAIMLAAERVVAGGKTIEVARMRITDAGGGR